MKKLIFHVCAVVLLIAAIAFFLPSFHVSAQTNSGPLRISGANTIVLTPNVCFEATAGAGADTCLVRTAAGLVKTTAGDGATLSIGGSITTNGTAVGAGTCQAQPALTVTGVTTSSGVEWSVPNALPATWQTGIHVMPVVTANTVTLSLCNASAGSITPAAQAVNIRVIP